MFGNVLNVLGNSVEGSLDGARAMRDITMDAPEMGHQGFLCDLALPSGGGVLWIVFGTLLFQR